VAVAAGQGNAGRLATIASRLLQDSNNFVSADTNGSAVDFAQLGI
jgi:hypothetical protein